MNFVEPTAVLVAVAPVICSVIMVPLALVPVTVNVLPLSSVEQYIVTNAEIVDLFKKKLLKISTTKNTASLNRTATKMLQ